MIVETAIVCATVVVVVSLRTASKFAPPKPRLTKEAIAEKRRLLTEKREMWLKSWRNSQTKNSRGDHHDWSRVEELDRALLALADEDREPPK